jgi:hypothetical protein
MADAGLRGCNRNRNLLDYWIDSLVRNASGAIPSRDRCMYRVKRIPMLKERREHSVREP